MIANTLSKTWNTDDHIHWLKEEGRAIVLDRLHAEEQERLAHDTEVLKFATWVCDAIPVLDKLRQYVHISGQIYDQLMVAPTLTNKYDKGIVRVPGHADIYFKPRLRGLHIELDPWTEDDYGNAKPPYHWKVDHWNGFGSTTRGFETFTEALLFAEKDEKGVAGGQYPVSDFERSNSD